MQCFQSIQQAQCLRAGVRFDIAGYHVDTLFQGCVRGFQHSVGFPYTGGVSKKYFQLSSGLSIIVLLYFSQDFIWSGPYLRQGRLLLSAT